MAPFWNPETFARKRPNLEIRQRVIAALRSYFAREQFAAVETPALQISPGNEAHLQAFATELKDPRGGKAKALYLHTSPEFAMKKLLVAGMPRIYQLAHCFRNGERSSLHHPEFLMCEWYRAGATLDAILRDCVELVREAAAASARTSFTFKGVTCELFGEWEKLSVGEAFKRYAGIDLLKTLPDPQKPEAALLAKEAQRIGERVNAGESWDDLFFRIMGEKIEPYLGKGRPTFLCDYPIHMAALARPRANNPRFAERAELYICGIELANGFNELTDANEQARRFQAEMNLKEKLYGERYPVDVDFIAALRQGMPDAAGIAFGVDRLVMLCAGTETIEDVLWVPVAE